MSVTDKQLVKLEDQAKSIYDANANANVSKQKRHQCKVCKHPAVTEAERLWQKTQNISEVQKMFADKYSYDVRWNTIDNHMKKHFMPLNTSVMINRDKYIDNIKNTIDIDSSDNKLAIIEGIIYDYIVNTGVCVDATDKRDYDRAAKTVAKLAEVMLKLVDFQHATLHGGKSDSDMQDIAHKLVNERIKSILSNLDKETASKVAQELRRTDVNG